MVLREEPLCRMHWEQWQERRRATLVDHIQPRDPSRPELDFDRSNVQPLCHSCHWWKHHQQRTGAEDLATKFRH